MRVAALVPAYPPRSNVGAWVATHRFLAHLVAAGHHVDVFVRADHGQSVDHLDGVAVGSDNNTIAVDTAVAICDIVISHIGDTERAAVLANRWGKPNVRMAHGKIEDMAALEGAAMVVFNSHNLAESVQCPSPSIVCHPPVDAARFATTPGDHVTLINLSEPKGGELFWRLVRCAPHRRFLGVKGAYGHQYLEERPNAEVVPNTANMRDDVYRRTRILLMPSERETWGMTAVEAMASGIPVVAHPTSGLLESLGPAGIFVDRNDGQGWLDQIERLHDRGEWVEASARSLTRSAELDPAADLDRFLKHITYLHTGRLGDLVSTARE